MIEVRHLSKRFGSLTALDDLSLALHYGQVVSLLGPNGSGKTTFIKSILGMVVPDRGEILVEGQPIASDWSYRRHIGYMPQIGRYPDNMKIAQVFAMMKDLRGKDATRCDEELIEAFGLPALMHKPMRTLSGGTRQKVSACLAFLFDPPILILDEPTAGLDPLASELLKDKIRRENARGKLILLSSHILSDLEELATDAMYLIDGKLRFFASMEALKQETGQETLGKAIAHLMTHGFREPVPSTT